MTRLDHTWSTMEAAALKRRRKALGLTQAQFGGRLGLGQAMISRLEAARPPSTVVAAAIRFYLAHYQTEKTDDGEKTEDGEQRRGRRTGAAFLHPIRGAGD